MTACGNCDCVKNVSNGNHRADEKDGASDHQGGVANASAAAPGEHSEGNYHASVEDVVRGPGLHIHRVQGCGAAEPENKVHKREDEGAESEILVHGS